MSTSVDILNRRLRDSLGGVGGGVRPRFAWKWAPDQPWFVYDRDNRTLLKKSWADFAAPEGRPVGRRWVLAGWQESKVVDHFGFSNGLRIPFIRSADYQPYWETMLPPGAVPTDALTQRYISDIGQQLARSVEHDPESFNNYMAEEKYAAMRSNARDREQWREMARGMYDNHVGAFGNCEPGKRHGYLSFQNNESGRV